MTRAASTHTAQAHALSMAMQARAKAENHAATPTAQALRLMAANKEASAALLLKQHDQRCSANPDSRFTPATCALWEGHFALLERARELRRIADEADPPAPTPAIDPAARGTPLRTNTHRVALTD